MTFLLGAKMAVHGFQGLRPPDLRGQVGGCLLKCRFPGPEMEKDTET